MESKWLLAVWEAVYICLVEIVQPLELPTNVNYEELTVFQFY